MSIVLHDIPAAVREYLDDLVIVKITAVVPTDPDQNVLTTDQVGAFTVSAFNGGVPNGVRVINVLYHVAIADAAGTKGVVAKLLVPDLAVGETFADQEATRPLKPGTRHTDYFVRLPDTDLGQGDTSELPLTLICLDDGDAKISCHVHADVDRDALFPNSESHSTGQGLTVL
ncbi:hypothetical protein [Actinoplanes sp. L3-i22]|uniref:hypothetical protein n=1 Tax=Actinoplanes sp. L3-i22 TaxID=2836373 RepID=UPI001C75ED75|nr:hypothetical protein [Actinoplanes sp. L3-i22]BCY11989.1 hypothetical protein L3i22_070770 [Actinoplanes sp. L3-i22]